MHTPVSIVLVFAACQAGISTARGQGGIVSSSDETTSPAHADTQAGFPFSFKCKVASVAAAPGPPPAVPLGPLPGVPVTTTWSLGASTVQSNGTEWSEQGSFTAADAKKAEGGYPGADLPSWWKGKVAVITKMAVKTSPHPCGTNGSLTAVQCELTPSGEYSESRAPITVEGLLFGGSLGLMLSYGATSGMTAPIMTMADFNKNRYGKAFAAVSVKKTPQKFPVVDRCICGDSDWNDWSSCISALNSLGLNGIETDPVNIFDVKMLEMNKQHLTSGGIYSPPGAEPDSGLSLNATYMEEWAAKQFANYYTAGFKPEQITTFALADEPGWYFPAEAPEHYMNASLGPSAAALKTEWEKFLSDKKVTGLPAIPETNRWQLSGLAAKKLFYWSSRFSSYSSASAFARATAAMEAATVKGVPICAYSSHL